MFYPSSFSRLGLGVLALSLLGGCVGSSRNLEQQVAQHDQQLRQMQPNQADTWNQLQSMRQDLNSLKGQMDELQSAGGARAISERLRKHDAALRQVESSMALNLNLGEPMPAAGAPSYTPGFIPPAAQAASPATGAYGLPAEPGASAATGAAVATGATAAAGTTTWGQADPKPVLEVPKKDISLALFDAGVNSFNARRYDEAQRSFSDFLKNYKDHSQSAEAQYYLAECYFQKNQFPEAALAYDAVIKKYPKSASAPGAYLKQGIAFSKINQTAAAKARMQELISKFPNSPEAARARSFLKTNK